MMRSSHTRHGYEDDFLVRPLLARIVIYWHSACFRVVCCPWNISTRDGVISCVPSISIPMILVFCVRCCLSLCLSPSVCSRFNVDCSSSDYSTSLADRSFPISVASEVYLPCCSRLVHTYNVLETARAVPNHKEKQLKRQRNLT